MSTQTNGLQSMLEKPRRSPAWESGNSEIVRFWTDDGNCYGFIFHHVTATYYDAHFRRLRIDWALGTLIIAGPRVLDFYEDFSNHRASVLRADGTEITSVVMEFSKPKKDMESEGLEWADEAE
jgi:hypothetical protein